MKLKHKPVKRSEYYKVGGSKIERTKRTCDRCGDGTFMAEHKDRWYCGKCGMTVWKKPDELGDKASRITSSKKATNSS